MKVGDEVYLNPKSEYPDGTEFNPLGIKGKIASVAGRIYVHWENGKRNDYDEEDLILASEYGVPAMNQGHPNAAILMEIAKEAAVNPEYWKEFQWQRVNNTWVDVQSESHLVIFIGNENPVRRKPRTIRIGNYDVPEPSGAWINPFIKGDGVVVDLKFKTNDEAEIMLKALQELLGKK